MRISVKDDMMPREKQDGLKEQIHMSTFMRRIVTAIVGFS